MNDLLLKVLRGPWLLACLSLSQWDLVIRQARNANLLGRIAESVRGLRITVAVPPNMHLASADAVAQCQYSAVRWEVLQLFDALRNTGVPLILLKGAGYLMAGVPIAQGRVFSDIDILVPKHALPSVEAALMMHGWASIEQDAYDQHYYRTWMHELPPMEHLRRGSVLDVHHAILPETARHHPSSEKLIAASIEVGSTQGVRVLAPVDMVLHSATHLFHDGEWDHGLRDLVDLDGLLRHFGRDEQFWSTLVPRAAELDLVRPLFYALRYTRLVLRTPVRNAVVEAVGALPGGRPSHSLVHLMDALFLRALRPPHSSAQDALTPFAQWLLYVRAHWLRMPPHLLIYHLTRKALFKPRAKSNE